GLVVLTAKRLLAVERGGERWQSHELPMGTFLRNLEHGGAGTLELVGVAGRVARWQYTAGRSAAARRLAQRLADLRAGEDGKVSVAVCPSCGAPITGAGGRCETCDVEQKPPSVASLFRLGGFARHRAGLIARG